MLSTQVGWPPEQSPVQPVNREPASAVAVSVTWVPNEKVREQVAPQSMAPTSDETVPVPVPTGVTTRL